MDSPYLLVVSTVVAGCFLPPPLLQQPFVLSFVDAIDTASFTSSDFADCGISIRPNFKVDMAFGLHHGWAIEGAIGSYDKTLLQPAFLSCNPLLSAHP